MRACLYESPALGRISWLRRRSRISWCKRLFSTCIFREECIFLSLVQLYLIDIVAESRQSLSGVDSVGDLAGIGAILSVSAEGNQIWQKMREGQLPLVTIEVELLCAARAFPGGMAEKPRNPRSEFIASRKFEGAVVLEDISRSEYP